ncbi:unnamed protein product, partial [Mesorhabditis belari]|uniref:Probable V-type proton ATPase subunit G n=1 Tax=Mesorhabditis belari TaxID=2138241 RepID=A0AAF3EG69_9BILA
MKQGVPIALLSSEAADARLKRLGLDSWSGLFYPFAEINFNIKALLACSSLDECQKKFQHYFSRFVEPNEYETFRTYVACVFLVAGCEEKPLGELSSLIQLQNTQQHGTSVEGNVLAPSHCAPPKWRAPNTLKHYFCLHDCVQDDETRTQETFRQLCATYGADSCHLLRIGSENGQDSIDVWSEVIEETEILQRGLSRARSTLLNKSTSENKENANASISTISPGFVITGSTNGSENLVNNVNQQFQPLTNRKITIGDHEVLRATLQEFTEKNLIPYIERLMRSLQEAVSQRRGIPRSLTANMKKWFATPAVAQTAIVSYSNESVEMQSRRLADLFFEFGLYEKAHQQYQSVKKEFAHDNAWAYHAAALDMSSYAFFLSNPGMLAKNFPVRYFENALTHLLTTNVRYTCPLRCVLQAFEVLTRLELNVEAAMQLVRITQMDVDNFVAVCLSMAAVAFERARMDRKAAFYRVLAGNRFMKALLPRLAIECYRMALSQYFEKNWDHAEDFLALAISRECDERKISFACATRLLRTGDHQNSHQQAEYLSHFVATVKRFSLDAKERVHLRLPLIDAQATTVVCGERPSSQTVLRNRLDGEEDRDEKEHQWEEIQRAAYHSLAGPSSAFQYICVVSDQTTNNTRIRQTPAGERFRLMVRLRNPLSIPLCLQNLKAAVVDVKLRENHPPSSVAHFEEISVCEEVTIEATSEKMVELYLRPSAAIAHFRVSGIELDLVATGDEKEAITRVHGFLPIALRGPRLNKRADHKLNIVYSEDRRLEVNVSASKWPLLDVEMERPLPEYVFCGQAVRIVLNVENIGDEAISGFCIATDGVDCCSGGIFDQNGLRLVQPSCVSENNAQIRVLTFPGVSLANGDRRRVFVDIRAPQQPSKFSVGLLVFYRSSNGSFREQRILVPLNCRPLLSAHGCLLDPIHGLISIDIRNQMPTSDAALARIDICRISSHLVHMDRDGGLVESREALALRPIRLRSVQLDCAQSDSVCVSVTAAFAGSNSLMWLTSEIPDCPIFPLPLASFVDCVTQRPTLLIAVLWKASIVNNQGQVSSILGESVVFDPFAAAGLRIPGIPWPKDEEDSDKSRGVYIYVGHLAPIAHDFRVNRICEFPVELHIRNDENRDCALTFRFTPKIPLPLATPLPVDSRQQWWTDREEWSIRCMSAHSETVSLMKIRVAHPSFYDLFGNQLQVKAVFSDGSESLIVVPPVHALVTPIMAAQTQGIQQLLSAEKRAAEKINEARKRKTQRLKQAKQEAQQEVEKYRQERENEFKAFEQKYLGTKEDIEAQIRRDTEAEIDNMKRTVAQNKQQVIVRLLQRNSTDNSRKRPLLPPLMNDVTCVYGSPKKAIFFNSFL